MVIETCDMLCTRRQGGESDGDGGDGDCMPTKACLKPTMQLTKRRRSDQRWRCRRVTATCENKLHGEGNAEGDNAVDDGSYLGFLMMAMVLRGVAIFCGYIVRRCRWSIPFQ
jgi:hypothetical protein